jgi:hypothetical protein
MSNRGNRSTRPYRQNAGPAPDAVPGAAPAGLGPGDPLVRALATCIRQAHARRRSGTALD